MANVESSSLSPERIAALLATERRYDFLAQWAHCTHPPHADGTVAWRVEMPWTALPRAATLEAAIDAELGLTQEAH